MRTIRVYKGQRIKDGAGNKTSFFVDTKGKVYEDRDGTVRRVGELNKKDGGLNIRASYSRKFRNRLAEITVNKNEGENK